MQVAARAHWRKGSSALRVPLLTIGSPTSTTGARVLLGGVLLSESHFKLLGGASWPLHCVAYPVFQSSLTYWSPHNIGKSLCKMQNLLKTRLLNYSVESTVYTLKFPKIPIKILSCPNTLLPGLVPGVHRSKWEDFQKKKKQKSRRISILNS